MITVESKLIVYEVDGEETRIGERQEIIVRNHRYNDSMVVLQIDGREYTVSNRDMNAAVANATNVNRY